ncbi:MAG TPA: pilus assembly PilX N-terminal domain-containing protein [Thermoanaerobaculia bacterium]|nr:pilus assembly PilX N-terminal domain-containing protein [Thermoanaerobaculia bacterium]
MTSRRRRRARGGRREEGFILILAIFVLLIVTAAGLATMLTTSMDLTLSGNETKVSKVFYAADSGVGYSAARLRSDVNFIGGPMPVGVSSNYAGSGSGDIQVTITRPLLIGWQVQHGDPLLAQGTTYGTPQVVENLFAISSTASATSIQASKTIKADIAIYPQVLSNVPR